LTKEEALKLALGALEADELDMVDDANGNMVFRREQAITAINEALAQPAQEPFGWYSAQEDDFMTDKIRKEHKRLNSYTHIHGKFDLPLYTTPPATQPAQEPAQAPVGYVRPEVIDLLNRGVRCAGERFSPRADKEDGLTTAFYTTPPRRPWVSLTHQQTKDCMNAWSDIDAYVLCRAIEAKLEEANT